MEVKVTSLPDQGVVITTLYDCAYDAIEEIEKHLHTNSPISTTYAPEFHMNFQYRAVARCHPGDTWNEMVGKDLSFERAYAKYMKAKKRIINRFYNKVVGNLTDIRDYVNNHYKYRDREITLDNLYKK